MEKEKRRLATPLSGSRDELRPQLGRNLTYGLLDRLGRAIVTGQYETRPFPTEAELTRQHGVTRSVTREAVKMLTAKGLLRARPRQGTVVEPTTSWNLFDTDVLHWLLRPPIVSPCCNKAKSPREPRGREPADMVFKGECMHGFKRGAMRALLLGAALTLAAPALAQMGPGGGGGGGFPGGGGGRGHGGRGGAMGGGPRGERPRMMKPLKREKLDKAVTGMFRTADRNGDGLVTFEELKSVIEARRDARIKARFERIDADHNGSISAAEFFAWQHDMGSVASSEDQPVAEIGGPVSEAILPDLDADDMALRRLIEPLTAMVIVNANTNYDNGVSLDELLAYERRKFDAADIDHDGTLTADELRAAEPRDREGPGGPMGRPPRGGE